MTKLDLNKSKIILNKHMVCFSGFTAMDCFLHFFDDFSPSRLPRVSGRLFLLLSYLVEIQLEKLHDHDVALITSLYCL